MSKHTPGPWDYYFEPSDHYKHKIRSKPGLICQLPGWVIHDELRLEQEANARLIVAAPDLLAALDEAKAGLLWYQEMCPELVDGSDDEAMARIDAAIAKATGEHHDCAFPFVDSASPHEHQGMSLRDYFAAMALQGMLANQHPYQASDERMFARDAYVLADAMLEARK